MQALKSRTSAVAPAAASSAIAATVQMMAIVAVSPVGWIVNDRRWGSASRMWPVRFGTEEDRKSGHQQQRHPRHNEKLRVGHGHYARQETRKTRCHDKTDKEVTQDGGPSDQLQRAA